MLCSGNGDYEEGACRCYPGWKGGECQLRHDECVVADCGGHGKCVDGGCACARGFTGEACQESELERLREGTFHVLRQRISMILNPILHLQPTAPTPLAPVTGSAWRARACAGRAGAASTAASWTARPGSACPTAPGTASSTWSCSSASAGDSGPATTAPKVRKKSSPS